MTATFWTAALLRRFFSFEQTKLARRTKLGRDLCRASCQRSWPEILFQP